MTQDEILAALEEAKLSHYPERAEAILQPALALVPTATPDDVIPVGASKMGGMPDLPRATPWPHRNGGDDGAPPRALSFLLQVNLGDVTALMPDSPLPPSGLLSVFYDADQQPWGRNAGDEDAFKVLYTAGDLPLERCEIPAALRALMDADGFPQTFNPCAVQLHLHVPFAPLYDRLELRSQERVALDKALKRRSAGQVVPLHHQLLGFGQYMQNDLAYDLALEELGLNWLNLPKAGSPLMAQVDRAAGQWRFLLQIDSDEEYDGPGWSWGDVGTLYFVIHERDLAARDFSRVRMELQSS